MEPVERVVVDCVKVDEMVGKGKKKDEVNEDWYWELKGEMAHNKPL